MIEKKKLAGKDTEDVQEETSQSEKENKCTDAVLWIGASFYPEILCSKKPVKPPVFKYPPNDPWPRDCFVHEAELRGCCRKVPAISSWMIPEKSRIFLVHQNKMKKECCSLFGYYVLNRIEIVVPKVGSKTAPGGAVYIPHAVTDFEAYRSCGRRPNRKFGQPAIYLVDALAAEIVDRFAAKLGVGTLTGRAKRKLFEEAVKEACRTYKHPVTHPHDRIRANAELRGELVLFDKVKGKYPVVARRPQAFFRNLARIDGEKLFEEIEEWYNKNGQYTVKVPYCGYHVKGSTEYYAFQYGLTKAYAKIHNGIISFKPLTRCYQDP